MSFGLLLPAALLALAALLLPVLLHLVRQSDRTRVEFAALRWLTARAQPRRRPRLDEWLLLLLRLLLLALVALWLAQPVLRGRPDVRPWLLVHPAINASRAPPAATADEQRRWLAPGFPALEQAPPASRASIGSLLRELDAELPAHVAVRVLVPAQLDATDAERPLLRRKMDWTVVPGTAAFTTTPPPRKVRMAVHADPAHRPALPYLRAASAAWAAGALSPREAQPLRELASGETVGADDTHLAWLASAPVPAATKAWVRSGGVVLLAHDGDSDGIDWRQASIAWRSADGSPLALRVQEGAGAWARLLAPFDPQSLPALLEPEFPRLLQDLLTPAPVVATRAAGNAYAPATGATAGYPQAPHSLGPWLAWLIALLFAVERWMAASSRRRRT